MSSAPTQTRDFAPGSSDEPGGAIDPVGLPVFAFRASVFLVLAVVVAGALAYRNCFLGALALDDHPTLEHNPSIHSLGSWSVLRPPAEVGTAGRPFTNLTFAINYALSGISWSGYHAVNLAIHLATALFIAGIVRRTLTLPRFAGAFGGRATLLAAGVGILWVVHPLTTETVTYLSQRTEGLAACGYAATLYGGIRYAATHRVRWAAVAAMACVLGMASKETMVTAPVAVYFFDAVFICGSWPTPWRKRAGWYVALAGSWVLLAMLLATAQLGMRGVGLNHGMTPWAYALIECRALLLYVKLSIWPHPLVFDYGWATVASGGVALAAAGSVLLVIGVSAIGAARGVTVAWLGLLWLLLLAPTSSVVPIADQPIAESRAYLPLALVVAAGLIGGYRLLGSRMLLIALVVVPLGLATAQRNRIYRTETALWTDVLRHRPENPRAFNALGLLAAQSGDLLRAIELHERAVALRPGYAEAHGNLGVELLHAHRAVDALAHFRRAAEIHPDLSGIHANLASALLSIGDLDSAIRELQAAARQAPDDAKMHRALGLALAKRGAHESALAEFRAAVRLAPDDVDAQVMFGNALLHADDVRGAITAYEAALRVDARHPVAHKNLAVALWRAGDSAAALRHAAIAQELSNSGVAPSSGLSAPSMDAEAARASSSR